MHLTSAFLAALLLDALLGDPPSMPHPIRWMGRLIAALERHLYRGPGTQRLAGVALVLLVVSGVFSAASVLLMLAAWSSVLLAWLLVVWMLFTCFAMRSLWTESMRVAHALSTGDLAAARIAASRIVGRDTENLPEQELLRAAVETVAENSVDAVLAPLLAALLGGAPLALAYKAVNTLDSMVGYRSERYLRFGWAAARLDDILNYLPARLAGAGLALSAWLYCRRGAAAWRMRRRDGARHPSPNAGIAEATMAGALGVQLGGDSTYLGRLSSRPTLGDAERCLEQTDIRTANVLVLIMAVIALVVGLALRLAIAGW